jgi:Patatin-like phospholipase
MSVEEPAMRDGIHEFTPPQCVCCKNSEFVITRGETMDGAEPKVGVALSGGGHRAALFGLGALLYLVDVGKGPQLGSVASVSGGSLTNAFFGATVDLSTVEPQAMWTQARVAASQITRRGTLWAAPLTYVYLTSLLVPVVAAVALSCIGAAWLVVAAAWLVAIVLCGWLSQQRSAVAARAFDWTLLHGIKLANLKGAVSHIMCATDLQMGQDVFFSNSFVYSWRSGWGSPGSLRAAQAVQASAALPGAFNVVSFPLRRFGLPEQRVIADLHPPRRFKLLDGGVYDNMGSEWLLNVGQRLNDEVPPAGAVTVAEAIVVNASAGDDVIARPWVRIPILGELFSLLAVKDVMYRQTTAVRRRLLNLRYQLAQEQPHIPSGCRVLTEALRGTTVQIDRSPFDIPTDFAPGNDAFAARAAAAIGLLGESTRQAWADDARSNSAVKTTLSKIEPRRAQSLIRHAYVLTMVNSHVLLNYPLLSIPDRFAWLVTPDS